MSIDATKIAKVKTAMDNRYENKQSNKKTSITGSFSGDNDSYPTVLACLNKFGELVTSWGAEPSDSKYPSEKLVKSELDKKIDKSSTVGLVRNDGSIDTTNYITSASVPTNTSDLTNDGADGTNVFVSNNDSRLSDARTPTSHTHGNLTNDGKIGTANGKIITTGTGGVLQASDSITTSMISDFPTDLSPTAHTHSVSEISDSNAHSNLNTSANATQGDINTAIDTLIGSLLSIDLIEVTTNKGTASANTMNKLYLVAEQSSATNDNYEIFVTVRTGTSGNYSYAWEKIDTARIDLSGYVNTAGTGLSKSGTTLNHTNSVTAITTESFKKFKFDSQGHITGTSDVTASDLPTHTHNYTTMSDVDSEINQALDDLAEAIYPTS